MITYLHKAPFLTGAHRALQLLTTFTVTKCTSATGAGSRAAIACSSDKRRTHARTHARMHTPVGILGPCQVGKTQFRAAFRSAFLFSKENVLQWYTLICCPWRAPTVMT